MRRKNICLANSYVKFWTILNIKYHLTELSQVCFPPNTPHFPCNYALCSKHWKAVIDMNQIWSITYSS